MSAEEQEWLYLLVQGETTLNHPKFLRREEQSQARILDSWIDFLQYTYEGQFKGETATLRGKILLRRSKLPILEASAGTPDPPDPSLGSRPTRFRLGSVFHPEFPTALELGVWSSHHDLMGDNAGHLREYG